MLTKNSALEVEHGAFYFEHSVALIRAPPFQMFAKNKLKKRRTYNVHRSKRNRTKNSYFKKGK